jgi:hypothetical protein
MPAAPELALAIKISRFWKKKCARAPKFRKLL